MPIASAISPNTQTLIDALLAEQSDLSASERFARWHDTHEQLQARYHRLIPLTAPRPGEQFAFEVDLDRCSGCKACVSACHSLNGLDEGEAWRETGLLVSEDWRHPFQQTVTTACHHCVDPACLNGCPVLAYDKDPLTGIVRHLDDQCIGCQYCILMCPYEVPKYSEVRGIVRKCDMCHQRLAHGEAPACVQACPAEAIHITVVNQEAVRANHGAADSFLPASPDPAITLPTTRYISLKPLPAGLVAGDARQVRLQPAHSPLALMLVLTQFGAGGFVLLPLSSRAAQPALAMSALLATLLGLAASVAHLGQPLKAWRAFLGLRRSWLSREIVAFGAFVPLAIAATVIVNGDVHAPWQQALLWLAALAGMLAVACSGMVYHATRREGWRGARSIGRFFGTAAVLGLGAASWAAIATGARSIPFAIGILIASLIKLSGELAALRNCEDDAGWTDEAPSAPLARGAFLMRFRLGLLLRLRLAAGWAGAVLPLIGLVTLQPELWLALVGLLMCLSGEIAERVLFFRAVAPPRMPGGVAG